MIKILLSIQIILMMLASSTFVNAQFLMPKLCTASGSSGILIQQVDEDWNKVPFDCENIEVLITGESFENHSKPGQLYGCKYKFGNSEASMISILGEQPGTYDVLVKRFDEESYFQSIKVKWDNSGCDVVGQIIEVQFDMTQQARK
ncbi:hypothetical protein MNBD_GAMMA02-570 [hydrothermal vent metagenome]|uniref:Uncharacterized protein n=1 Tax=hydrothermal vent metagenome TaxID=652676 RepID=A0A3B0WU35_9ZZZZ